VIPADVSTILRVGLNETKFFFRFSAFSGKSDASYRRRFEIIFSVVGFSIVQNNFFLAPKITLLS
jgi:hypothetical protein